MAYYETTYASSATPAVDVMNDMQTKLPANGWTFVETFTSGTDVTDVYKSPAAGNSLGVDYFIYLNRTATTATFVSVGISEQYDSTGKKALKYNTNVTTALTPNQTDYTVNDTGVVLNGASALNKIVLFQLALNTARTFNINITPDRVIVCSVSLGSVNGGYVGVFDHQYLHPAWAVPLGMNTFTGSTNFLNTASPVYGGTTRDPNVSTATAYCFRAGLYTSSSLGVGTNPFNGGYGAVTSLDQYGTIPIMRVGIATRADYAFNRLIMKDIISTGQGGANYAGGDTLAVTYGSTTLNYVSIPKSTYLSSSYTMWMPKQ
jgi:hypothetical protein